YYGLPVTGIADEVTLNKIKEILEPPYQNGDRGKPVVELKQNLTKLGFGNFPTNPSIYYGSVTANVVKDFQKFYSLEVDGIAGEETLQKIEEVIENPYENGSRGSHVVQLKKHLSRLGFGNFPVEPSSTYGKVTTGVVKDFQVYYGLSNKTGKANNETIEYLNKVLNSSYQSGKSGSHVVKLKKDLTLLGFGNFPKSPSKAYGAVTEGVVKDFQKAHNLTVNGIADEVTLAKIEELVQIISQKPLSKTESTNYDITFTEALDIQMIQFNQTDKHRGKDAYVHKDYLRFIGTSKIAS